MMEFLVTLGDPEGVDVEVYAAASRETLKETVDGAIQIAEDEEYREVRVWRLTDVSVTFDPVIKGLDDLLQSK